MMIKITDDAGEVTICTFAEFLAANDWTPDERADWQRTLSTGESFYVSGGAAPVFLIEPVDLEAGIGLPMDEFGQW